MNDESRYILDTLLADWHRWARGYQHIGDVGTSPMFNQTTSPRGWDTVNDIVEHEIDGGRMSAVNFHIFELTPIWCTAIQIQARNLATGKSVWTSARLPTDLQARALLLAEARAALMCKLITAGVV